MVTSAIRIWADFKAREGNWVPIDSKESIADIRRQSVELREGLQITVYDDQHQEEATVEKTHGEWWGRIIAATGHSAEAKGMRGTWQESYREWADAMQPELQAALSGRREVPAQKPSVETWLALALHDENKPLYLWEVIASADALNHLIPNPDEVAWAFISLRKRGWLEVEGEMYRLTIEGRRSISTIVSQGNYDRLNRWILAHPPSGPVRAREVFLNIGKRQ